MRRSHFASSIELRDDISCSNGGVAFWNHPNPVDKRAAVGMHVVQCDERNTFNWLSSENYRLKTRVYRLHNVANSCGVRSRIVPDKITIAVICDRRKGMTRAGQRSERVEKLI